MNNATIEKLIRTYPFILLKTYNSFVEKVFYFNKELKMNIEEVDIYPIIYIFDLNRDIIPRVNLMKKNNQWLPFKEAFSMSLEELAQKLNSKETISTNFDASAPLYERDLLFRYSKYSTI
jgi:hypothetical protein